ncbi:FAD-binding monooxygenase [Nocardioides humilatus]|uniref:FAD-binding monooxygenase n=1 Tax=Nocardioides humilatus TaxID=2607660 RepID=A0A5B1L887_9ACTN|nr:FAD-binding monooxygenase [Nocardioides humilatus]KAA1415980.1 FAD-binding monooxygenase [Nocardioides humilatus]
MNHLSRTSRHGAHAVVIGASMGGLVAAAAVAPYFDRVTVLDHDALPTEPAPRRGVPQGRHAHALQPGGLLALEDLLPGITDDLVAGGGRAGDASGNCGWWIGGGTLARGIAGNVVMGITRPYLEHTVRTRIAALPNVTLRDQTDVVAPLGKDGHVRGVAVTPTGGGTADEISADLVIDCSGRVSKLPDWLTGLGLPAPEEERVHCKMSYLTRRWRFANDVMGADVFQVITPDATPHFGVCILQEDGTYIVTLGGLLDGAPAKTDEAYLAFARALSVGRIADALDGAEPVTEFQPSHFPYSRRRRYDRVATHPVGLLALGDSIASFNPMYGQGMSVAALQAVALRDMLRRGPVDPKAYYRKAHGLEDVAWKITTSGDLRFDEVEGKRTPDMKFMNSYLDRLTLAARTDPVLAQQFLRVAGFIDPPTAFFKPSVLMRVFRRNRSAATEATATSAAAA